MERRCQQYANRQVVRHHKEHSPNCSRIGSKRGSSLNRTGNTTQNLAFKMDMSLNAKLSAMGTEKRSTSEPHGAPEIKGSNQVSETPKSKSPSLTAKSESNLEAKLLQMVKEQVAKVEQIKAQLDPEQVQQMVDQQVKLQMTNIFGECFEQDAEKFQSFFKALPKPESEKSKKDRLESERSEMRIKNTAALLQHQPMIRKPLTAAFKKFRVHDFYEHREPDKSLMNQTANSFSD